MKYIAVPVIVALSSICICAAQPARDREAARRHLRAGQEALEIERWEEAERDFSAALKLDPSLDLAHYGLGQVHMATRRYAQAVRAYTRSREVFHENMAENLTDRLADERRLDDQIRELKDIRRALEMGRIRSQNTAASVHQYGVKISQLEALRRRDPAGAVQTPPYIQTALGSAYFRNDAFADAEREWRLAATVDPTVGEVHNNLAVVYMLTGRYDEAEREVYLAEKNGFRVNPGLKADIKARKAR